jgi:hypothetical protein
MSRWGCGLRDFVLSAEVLALRCGVSEQQVNPRVRRLLAVGWVARSDE